jgi:ABC-type antimicrobial peptide transport system permease subunit
MKQFLRIIGVLSTSAGLLGIVLNSVLAEFARNIFSNLARVTQMDTYVSIYLNSSSSLSTILVLVGVVLIVCGTVQFKAKK